MKNAIVCFIGLVFVVSVSAEPLLEGRVRLESGEPVADAQVRLFDLTDLGQGAIARAQTDGRGYFALPLAALRGSALPEGFTLGPNYPNPFNPSTIIPYQLAAQSQVRLEVFNLLGQHLATLVDGERPAGFHTATWHATDAAGRAVGAGVYIYRMTVGAASQTGRMVLIDGQAGVAAMGAASVWSGVSGGDGSDGTGEQMYGLIVSGSGLVPYIDSAFRVEAGMAPVELVVSAGLHSAGKATDDDCPLCDFFDAINDQQLVTIPDAKLRAAIAAALGKATGEPITQDEMKDLTFLNKGNGGIRDLKGLEFATNLEFLNLSFNNVSDVSPLRHLTNLSSLFLEGNAVSDISSLRHLTNLSSLNLGSTNVSDISSLRHLTNLSSLNLSLTNVSNISSLRHLTNLRNLNLQRNLLSASSINDHIPALKSRGVKVEFDPKLRESDFDIELVFLDDHFTEKQKRIVRYAARRWMSIIREDLPDYTFARHWSGTCGDQPYEIPSGERIDDLRIYVGSVERMEVRIHVANEEVVYESRAQAGPTLLRETFLPVLGCVTVNSKFFDSLTSIYLLDMSLHEMGHVLGIGTTGFRESGFLRDSSDGPYFNGPRAIAAFDDAGGRNYTGAKVPLEKSGGHWRSPVLEDELMSSMRGISMLSAITIQALADLGYVVDVTQADPYTLPRAGISRGGDDMEEEMDDMEEEEEMQPVVDVAQADPYAAKASAKIAAPSTHAQPEWSCGVGEQREPIYVIDQEGRIVRTLGD